MREPTPVRFTSYAEQRAAQRGLSLHEIGALILEEHGARRRNPGSDSVAGVASDKMKADSYYSPEGDIAYLHVRTGTRVRTEKLEWGLGDYDVETGELVGLEIWEASKAIPREVVEALPRLEGGSRVWPPTGG